MEIEINKNGVNKKIKVNMLSDSKMKQAGFTDHNKSNWCFTRSIEGVEDISFNVSISKKDIDDLHIDVLDEKFLQPYDYQSILERKPTSQPCLIVKEEVEKWMKYLEDAGVLSGHVYGEYI